MRRIRLDILVVGMIALASVISTVAVLSKENEPVNKTVSELVYEICQGSRISDQYTEKQCGEAQDSTRYRYSCEQRNKSADNKCIVEKVNNYVEII